MDSTGATVTLAGTSSATVTADANGNYSFGGLSDGSYTVTPNNASYTFSPSSQSVTVSGASVSGVNFKTRYKISGSLGSSGSGATVTLGGAASATVTANNSGNFSFGGLAPGTYTVTPASSGITFSPASQTVTISTTNNNAVNFAELWSASGNVGTNGGGATVNLSGAGNAAVTADASGNFSFKGLANGTYNVQPSKASVTFSPLNQSVTINGSNVSAVNFSSQPTSTTYSITGSLSAGGSGATIALSGATSGTSVADSSGNFSFSGLGSGSYTLTPSLTGVTFSPISQNVTINGANVSGVSFAELYNISGSLGTAGASASIALSGAAANSTIADSSGNFLFSNLAAGSYTVTPSKSGVTFSPASKNIAISTSNVIGVNFSELWQIGGSLGAGGTGATVSLSGSATATVTADGSGNFVFPSLLNGSYTVTPSLSGIGFSPVNRSVSLSNANVTGLTFAETYGISGTVSATGSGATITLGGAKSATTTADANGNFSFNGLLNGSYSLTPTDAGVTFSPSSQSVSVSGGNVVGITFTATGTAYSVSLAWNASTTPNVTYNMYRCTTSATACTSSQIANFAKLNSSPITTTAFLDSNVAVGQTYYYGVTAVDSSLNESGMSNISTSTIP
jgi:hypothetical protein